MTRSIRTRSTLYFTLFFGVLLAAFASILCGVVMANLERDYNRRIQHDADLLTELFKEEMRLNALQEFQEEAAELGLNLRVMDAQDKVLFQSRMWGQTLAATPIPPPSANLSEVWTEVTVANMPHTVISRRVEIDPYPPFVLQLAQPQDALIEMRRLMTLWSLRLIPVMLAMSGLAGFLLSGRLLAPIGTLRQRAGELQPRDLSARIPLPQRKDEVYFLTETLNAALDRIEKSSALIKAFAADASHELRIPLTAMRGTLELALRKERSSEEYRTALAEALEEAEHLSRLTSDLLALTRTEAGGTPLRITPVALQPFLERVVAYAAAAHPNARLVVSSVPEKDVPMDADQVERAILNVLDNALKYAPEGTPVELRPALSDQWLSLRIIDQGPGIPPEHRERIFDRFYRAPHDRARTGSGLGLAIAAAIIRAHSGEITLENSTSSGSVFHLKLPIRKV